VVAASPSSAYVQSGCFSRYRSSNSTVKLTIVSLANGCRPYSGAAVYLWHCTRDGGYSLYSDEVKDENFLRGVQAAGGDGTLTFKSIFPGAYPGRWPHMHFEVYPNLGLAASANGKLATSQLALPRDACDKNWLLAQVWRSKMRRERSETPPAPFLAAGFSVWRKRNQGGARLNALAGARYVDPIILSTT
jgi:protocatechuate 3,4-dioxygenase beta subunit